MKLYLVLLSIFVIFLLVTIKLISNNSGGKSYVQINGKIFYVDIAKTDKQKETGLDIYDKLPEANGMIFLFESSGYYTFWMNGMKFPIDIIYINNNKIVDIFQNLPFPKNQSEQPVVIRPKNKANYVLEINAGLSHKYNFKNGDIVQIKL